MKVKDVLAECLVKMGVENFISDGDYDEQQSAMVAQLLAALNCVYRDIVARYLALSVVEDVELIDGALDYQKLQNYILYPKNLYFEGEQCRFRSYPDRLESTFSGKAKLHYAYLPTNELKIEDEVSVAGLTPEAFSDGILAQYYLAQKMFDLAESFDSDFRFKMSALHNRGKSLRLKERRWQA